MMADLMQNMQDVFKKWESRGTSNFRGRRGHNRGPDRNYSQRSFDYSDLSMTYRQYGDRRSKQRSKTPFFKVCKYESLAQFKTAPTIMAENKQRPFMGSCCSKCLPLSRASVVDTQLFSLSICNILNIPLFQTLDFRVALNILKKKKNSAYPSVSSDVLKSQGVLSAIEDTVNEYKEELDNVETDMSDLRIEQNNKAKCLLENIKSSVSTFWLHISSFILHPFLSRMFDGILVHKGQLEILKVVNEENVPFIYIPLSHNYIDSVLISFILYMNSLKVPLVPIEQDLFIPMLSYLLKFLGAFIISSHLNTNYLISDIVHEAVLQNYITECLRNGHSLEIFTNKTFSSSNEFHMDKFSMLATVIESVFKENVQDVYISTVSISHEKLHNGSFVKEQLGQPKQKETLFATLHSIWKIMHMKFGSVRINFGQPFSLKEFLQTSERNISMTSTSALPFSSTEDKSMEQNNEEEQLKHALEALTKHVIYDATNSTSLMSTHLLAFLLVTQYRKGATQQQLQNSMDWLREQLANKKRDTGFTGLSLPVVKRAVEFLGKALITTEIVDMEWTSSDLENNNVKVTIHKPVIKLPHVLELQNYSSFVVPVFLLDSIVVNALYALVDVEICHFRHCDSQLFVSRDRLIDKAIELNDLLQYEFNPVPPCSDISLSFSDVLDQLVEKECLHVVGVSIIPGKTTYNRKPHTLCFDASDEEDGSADAPILKEQQLKVDLSEESINLLEFYRNILSPYIESYWLAACTLLKLIDEVKEESVFIQEMQQTAQEKLYKGLLNYEESFSAITFKNSLKLFEKWSVLESYEQDEMKIVYLSENYNNKENLNDIIARIEEFRK